MTKHSGVILLLLGSMAYAQSKLTYAQGAASFPTIDPSVQKARDDDRQAILETELQIERQELAKAQVALAAEHTQERAADVHRRSENVKALLRELNGVAGQQPSPREPLRLVAKAKRSVPPSRNLNGTAVFWNPYNRAPDPEVSADFSTAPRRELP